MTYQKKTLTLRSVMQHVVDNRITLPFRCYQCKHSIDGIECKAFDLIPDKFRDNAALHNAVVDGQKGNYIFETDQEQETRCEYVIN